jgi:ParB-like chromosome segregation protein Spo0J
MEIHVREHEYLNGTTMHFLIDGNRRLAAYIRLGWKNIPAKVIERTFDPGYFTEMEEILAHAG